MQYYVLCPCLEPFWGPKRGKGKWESWVRHRLDRAISLIRSVIIEDETLFRKLLHGFLEEDRRVEIVGEARDGEEGLELCRQVKPDLVLLDLGIPELSGEQLAEA